MSRVWLARHRELSVPVVIKTLVQTSESLEAFARLLNEARLMAKIPSARVVRAVDAGVHEGLPYIAQEYVDGIDLAELDRRRRSALGVGLPLWFVCHVAHEVADALHTAHQTGVLHRDVKPSNVLASPQTGIRLGDFGIAVARGQADRAGGTLRFIAPEALRGGEPSRAADVYSLGAAAFDLRYGRAPFVDVAELMGTLPPAFPAPRSPQEAYFQHVVARMLQRDPERRFPSVAAPRRLMGSLARTLRPSLVGTRLDRGVYQLGTLRVSCVLGDIAEATAEGIVNSANDEMRMRSGTGLALRQRGGDSIEDEAMAGGHRALGECIVTGGGTLGCKHVLHAVSAWKEVSCVARTCQRVFLAAEELRLRTLAVPALGTGAARIGPEASAFAAASALYEHVLLGQSHLRDVEFILYDRHTRDLFIETFDEVFLGDSDQDDADTRTAGTANTEIDETLFVPITATGSSDDTER